MEDERGDIMQLIFGEDSLSFQKSILFMGAMIGIGVVFGIFYEIARKIRSKMKVKSQGKYIF